MQAMKNRWFERDGRVVRMNEKDETHSLHRQTAPVSNREPKDPSRRSITRVSVCALVISLALGSCRDSTVPGVAAGTYRALVPTAEQLTADVDDGIPGGFTPLRDDGVDEVEMLVDGDRVTFRLDGGMPILRAVQERRIVRDREGSGPFKGTKEVLVLGDAPLVLGQLTIDAPVIWPGSFEDSPVVTVKPAKPDERGPDVSCRADENCLLLSSGVDPAGTYEDADDPALGQNPVASIRISDDAIELSLDTGEQLRVDRTDRSSTRACGLAETSVWSVPADSFLAMDDPVLVHTLCPTGPGGVIQLVIISRADIPVLAPLDPAREDDWCATIPQCLRFAPT